MSQLNLVPTIKPRFVAILEWCATKSADARVKEIGTRLLTAVEACDPETSPEAEMVEFNRLVLCNAGFAAATPATLVLSSAGAARRTVANMDCYFQRDSPVGGRRVSGFDKRFHMEVPALLSTRYYHLFEEMYQAIVNRRTADVFVAPIDMSTLYSKLQSPATAAEIRLVKFGDPDDVHQIAFPSLYEKFKTTSNAVQADGAAFILIFEIKTRSGQYRHTHFPIEEDSRGMQCIWREGFEKLTRTAERDGQAVLVSRTIHRCWNCGKTNASVKLSKCSRCETARYCSRQCQKDHWKEHKAECSAAK